MTFRPLNTKQIPLPENISFSKDMSQLLEQLTKTNRDIARQVNGKERAIYPLEQEILNDQLFFTTGNPQKYRNVFRKVFSIGAVATGATLNIVHNITSITTFTRIYGTCITNIPDDRPIPYVDTLNVTNQISLLRNGINLVLTNGATAPPIVSGIIIIEYLKN